MFDVDPIEQVFGNYTVVPGQGEALPDDDFQLERDDDLDGLLDRTVDLISFESAEENAALSPRQRIERLFENMYAYKQSLLDIISECRNPCSFERASQFVDSFQRSTQSVYAAESFLGMLVDAGALETVTTDGKPYSQTEIDPIEVERDGKIYLQVAKPPEVFWRATPAGLQALEEHDSLKAVEVLISKQPVFLSAYTVLLGLCARDEGASIVALKEAINDRPEMVEQKKTAQFLLDNLFQAGVLVYDADLKVWRTNRSGCSVLGLLETRMGRR